MNEKISLHAVQHFVEITLKEVVAAQTHLTCAMVHSDDEQLYLFSECITQLQTISDKLTSSIKSPSIPHEYSTLFPCNEA